jgi:CubicO group peptidase (beta-lactamase class C family)
MDRAKPETVGFSEARLKRASDALRREIANKTMPGAVLMIGRRGKIAHLEAMGVQDPATGAPMREDSIFRIFSMTKPIVSVGLMMLVEEGRIRLDDPLDKYIPAFGKVRVTQAKDGQTTLVEPARPILIHDLLRHTSGFAYEFLPNPLKATYDTARLTRRDQSNKEHAEALAALPLLCHPGSEWNYGRSVEVLGYVIEVVTGLSLGEYLESQLFAPLEMKDTGFWIRADGGIDRQAQAFPGVSETPSLFDMTAKPGFESAGGGLVSTAPDYARFAQMLLNKGEFAGRRYLSRPTLEYMTSDHLDGARVAIGPLPPGFGFGLGFAVRIEKGAAPFPGNVGQYFWNGVAGTQFWGDPSDQLWALLMVQVREQQQREHLRVVVRNLVYAAFDD